MGLLCTQHMYMYMCIGSLFQYFMQGVFMYWITSSLFSMGQIYLLKFARFRALMGIPEIVKHPKGETSKEGLFAKVMSSKSFSSIYTLYQQLFVCANGG